MFGSKRRPADVGLAVCLIATAAASIRLSPPLTYWEPETLAYLIPTGGMVALALIRSPPRRQDDAWWLYLVCTWSIVYPFAFHPAERDASAFDAAVVAARLWLLLIADLTLLGLGRSFGILPALRTIRSHGAYRVVRHPVYALYMIADALLLALQFSVWNLAVAVSGAATFLVRARREERLLATDPEYRAYAARVRWRFLRGVH